MDAATAAWLCALPCAVVAALAIVVLGAPVGRLLEPGHPFHLLSGGLPQPFLPEPTEQGRYAVALVAPFLLAWATASLARRPPAVPARVASAAALVAQVALLGVVVAALIAQHGRVYGPIYTATHDFSYQHRYFSPATLLVAALLAGALVLGIRSPRVRETVAGWLEPTRVRSLIAIGLAVAFTVVWMLASVNSDQSIASANPSLRFHLGFTLDETFAVVNGLTPLVDFTAQYGSLLPYLPALVLTIVGKTLLAFTLTMTALTTLALLAMFGVLRRVTRSPLGALALYLPFLATTLFISEGSGVLRDSYGSYFGMFPLRYGAPFLLAWLTARQLDRGGGGAGRWAIFLLAGLAVFNNVEFGVAGLGATFAALLWTAPEPRRTAALRLAGMAAAGLLGACALVAALTLVRTGELPQLGRLTEFARLFSMGFGMLPMAGVLGLPLLIYLTYVAAIGTGTVLAIKRDANVVLVGMLVWIGVFGLGSAGYYVGRSHPYNLVALFSPWSFAVVLLAYVGIRSLAAAPARRPTPAIVVSFFALGVLVCSLAQIPAPWSQLDRLTSGFTANAINHYERPLEPNPDPAEDRQLFAALADGPRRWTIKRGAPVVILLTTGHRIADANGVVNVSPYTGVESMPTVEQVDNALAALRAAGGNTVLVSIPAGRGLLDALDQRGFKVATPAGLVRFDAPGAGSAGVLWHDQEVVKFVDTRHLRAEALH
jgi:hypothetical protein